MVCEHEHTVKMFNYDTNDNVKAWIQCIDCNTKIEDVLSSNTLKQEVD